MESTALRSVPQSSLYDSLKARVVTKAFGLRIGAFGVDYTSKSVEVDPEQRKDAKPSLDPGGRRDQTAAGRASASPTDTRAQAFQTEMQRETLRRQVWDVPYRTGDQADAQAGAADSAGTGQDPTSGASASSSSHPDPAWRRGLTAYAQARDLLRSDALRLASTRLAVA